MCSDKLFIAAAALLDLEILDFNIGYGNVMGSKDLVYLISWIKLRRFIKITHPEMTRFNISLDEVDMVIWSINNSLGGNFCPKIPSYKVIDIANAIGPSCKKEIIGIRPGEK